MKYTDPTIRISFFYDTIKTEEGNIEPLATLSPVSSPNVASISLEEQFNAAAEGAAHILRFKWN